MIQHRGPTHSIITALLLFTPLIIIFRKKTIPYLAAYVQHAVISDFIAGGQTQLFWPLTSQVYGFEINIQSPANICIEWTAFIAATIILIKSKDLQMLLKPSRSNLLLLIPTCTVLLPTLIAFPLNVPSALIPPHIIFLALFSAAMLTEIKNSL